MSLLKKSSMLKRLKKRLMTGLTTQSNVVKSKVVTVVNTMSTRLKEATDQTEASLLNRNRSQLTPSYSDATHSESIVEGMVSSKSVNISNVIESDNMKRRTDSMQRSDNPITDSILDYLDASELNYYYHDPDDEQNDDLNHESATSVNVDSDNNFNIPAKKGAVDDNKSINETEPSSVSDGSSKRTVHHITMAMRYLKETSASFDDAEPSDPSRGQRQSESLSLKSEDVEWGCVIRVHEHTQLVAIYGVLPFNLPPSHLEAGMTLATHLNYDMMLGCIEVDIRDGEIRFKNSLDLEPIIQASGGIVPPTVINYLLKGVMAMTASFTPLFEELINNDPDKFQLQTILDQMYQTEVGQTFYLASTTPQ